ncbi:glycosyltransferase [Thioalkalivibrio sp. AKL12]|uniref:glycosyltransferase family 2 protein n=1 Tax=Thioalkalivibrio sp. AKL12 TaxID=1158159 RepID=UPI0003613FD5|nr:glycosyltransferase [Thioalkalivibrio sp. AKL12]
MTARDVGNPLVSVIMPAYNTAAYIAESVDSVLDQDYPSVELIVVDDGSTDGTIEILREYGDRLTLLTQQNQGAAVARNAGIAKAQGDYIAFIDSDDVWLPGKLTAQVLYMEQHPEIGFVHTDFLSWKPGADGRFAPARTLADPPVPVTEAPGIVLEGSGWVYNQLLMESLPHTITVMMRRTLVDQVGEFDPELKRGQDYDYWIRASRLTEYRQLDRVTALYRLHGRGCITKYPDVNYEVEVVQRALDRWGLVGPNGEETPWSRVRERLGEACFTFGYHHYWEGDPRIARRAFLQALLRKPGRAKTWGYLGASTLKALLPGKGGAD